MLHFNLPITKHPRIASMMRSLRIIPKAITWLCCILFAQVCFANDDIFPAQPAAQRYINFDGKGFIINGQRTFLASASMEYARVPRELWADRLMRIKRAGLNCVEIYTFWNYHEPYDGQFDFSGNRDLDAFLKLAKSLGLYVIARVGPYYCAEWDSGGYPVWLQFKNGMTIRDNNPVGWPYITRFWDHLFPIIVNNQINRGGNVILVQLENEYPWGWGTDGLSNPYLNFLRTKALSYGMEVPHFFSGLHHGYEPGGDTPFSSSGRTSPWFSTEFWSVWYDRYGQNSGDVITKDRATWKIISVGGNGYNYYMFHGGSNFEYYSCIADLGASYDYGASIGETGDLRPTYYKFKRAAWFARSFQNILANSDNATATYSTAAANQRISVMARQGSAGAILFLDNGGNDDQQTKVKFGGIDYPQSGSLTVKAHEIMPFVANYQIAPDVKLKVAPTRILGITQQAGGTTTIVIYGQAGTPAELYFQVPAGTTISSGAPALSKDGSEGIILKTVFPSNGVANYNFQAGNSRVRILAVNDTLADYTWFTNAGEQNYVVCGPPYIGETTIVNGSLELKTELPWQHTANFPVSAYDSSDTPVYMTAVNAQNSHPGAITPSAWLTMSGSEKAAATYNTSGWLSSTTGPKFMGEDGDISPYAWYRTTVNVPAAGTYSIDFSNVRNKMNPFVDGVAVPAGQVSTNSFTTDLSAGSHSIALFVAHSGRGTMYNTTGSVLNEWLNMGLKGPAYINQGASAPTTLASWRIMPATSSAVGTTPPSANDPAWSPYTVGTNALNTPGYVWIQTTLPAGASGPIKEVSFANVDDNCWVYLNNSEIASHTGWGDPFDVRLGSNWNASGPNTLTLLVQNVGGPGGIYPPVTFSTYNSRTAINAWVQQGGPGDPDAATGWSALANGATFQGPQFFKCTFNASEPQEVGANPIWRVSTTGLSYGTIWVNGHNLGRYPQVVPAPGIYIPEKWLNASGTNTLVIYDANGNRPDQVVIQPETASSRDIISYEVASDSPIQSGAIYEIKTALNDSSNLDVNQRATSNGAGVQIWQDNNGNNQRWKVIDADNGLYRLEPQHAPGKALDASASGTDNGTVVQIWDYLGGANQKWQINPVGGGYYELRPSNALNKVLDVSGGNSGDGTRTQLWDYANVPQQKWRFDLIARPGDRAMVADAAHMMKTPVTETAEISISPNPVHAICWITSKEVIREIVIYDIHGRIYQRFEKVNSNRYQVNMETAQPGMYLLSVAGSNFKKQIKMIKF